MVNLTKIYTKTGDAGQTRLSNNELTQKTDLRVAAYGEVDELNSAVGLVLADQQLPDDVRAVLSHIQNELFDLGADLSNPVVPDPPYEPLRIIPESIEQLERWCDLFSEELPNLRSFILPGGGEAAARLHLCRTIARRAERTAWTAAEQYGLAEDGHQGEGGVNILAIKYLNRLSDLMFILARYVTAQSGDVEVLWVPGGERNRQG